MLTLFLFYEDLCCVLSALHILLQLLLLLNLNPFGFIFFKVARITRVILKTFD
jgi:hypothetical protein